MKIMLPPLAQFCTLEGNVKEDGGRHLTNDEMAYFAQICHNTIESNNL